MSMLHRGRWSSRHQLRASEDTRAVEATLLVQRAASAPRPRTCEATSSALRPQQDGEWASPRPRQRRHSWTTTTMRAEVPAETATSSADLQEGGRARQQLVATVHVRVPTVNVRQRLEKTQQPLQERNQCRHSMMSDSLGISKVVASGIGIFAGAAEPDQPGLAERCEGLQAIRKDSRSQTTHRTGTAHKSASAAARIPRERRAVSRPPTPPRLQIVRVNGTPRDSRPRGARLTRRSSAEQQRGCYATPVRSRPTTPVHLTADDGSEGKLGAFYLAPVDPHALERRRTMQDQLPFRLSSPKPRPDSDPSAASGNSADVASKEHQPVYVASGGMRGGKATPRVSVTLMREAMHEVLASPHSRRRCMTPRRFLDRCAGQAPPDLLDEPYLVYLREVSSIAATAACKTPGAARTASKTSSAATAASKTSNTAAEASKTQAAPVH